MRQQTLNTSYWQILQIAPTGRPGELRVWALVKGEMHALSVNVYRKFYVNRRLPGEMSLASISSIFSLNTLVLSADLNSMHTRTSKVLPRAHHCFNLYEFAIPEADVCLNHS